MSEKIEREKKPTFDADYIRGISEAVYRDQLGEDEARRMVEKDEDSGEKLRRRAGQYDSLTRSYLKAMGIEPEPTP